jgi:hypothetical protein
MMRALTSDVMLRFLGGFAVGAVVVLSGATGWLHAFV